MHRTTGMTKPVITKLDMKKIDQIKFERTNKNIKLIADLNFDNIWSRRHFYQSKTPSYTKHNEISCKIKNYYNDLMNRSDENNINYTIKLFKNGKVVKSITGKSGERKLT